MKQQLLLGSLIIRKGQLIVPLEGLSFARQSWRVRWVSAGHKVTAVTRLW